jgi:hypothetical protein
MYSMYTGTIKDFFSAKTAHRFPKLVTLGVATSLLVSMVTIDASASSAYVGRNANSPSIAILMKLANENGNRVYSGVMKRHKPINGTTTTTTPTAQAPIGGGNGGGGTTTTTPTTAPPASTTTSTTVPPATTTTLPPTTTTTSAPPTSSGLIAAGPSRSECLEPDLPSGVYTLASLQAVVTSFDQSTHSTVTCLLAYLNTSQTWTDWQDPWIANGAGGEYTQWVAEAPQTRQLVLQVDLIPVSLKNINAPLGWEQSCAAGNFNSYATQLGKNLVAAGLQNTVIRLGAEMNGGWENDYIGTTTQEMSLWATCFANEVTALRQAPGEHFLIDWNPNACTQSVPYSSFYPGNAYVDMVGLDFYDIGCEAPTTSLSFTQLSNENYGLTTFEAFAAAQGEPMSLPEWGLTPSPSGDDPAYINGIGSTVASGNFSFEAYFDAGAGTLILGSGTPLSLVAFQKWFGTP